jgi:hypothetical protein
MKRVFVMLSFMAIVIAASAQKRIGTQYYRYYRPRTSIVVSGGYGYYPYYPMYYDYGFWGQPYYYHRPSKLTLQIEDIQSDYKDRIWSARHDDQLTKREKKQKIRELKSERDMAVRDAERNYYRASSY